MKTNVLTNQMPQIESILCSTQARQRAIVLASMLLLANSVLRGIRAPSRWAYTEVLSNYDFGFSKRGLLGAVISALDVPFLYHYEAFFWYGTAVFAVNIILLVSVLKRLISLECQTAYVVSLLFCSSFAIVVLSHCIGYGEQIGLAFTLVLLRTKTYYLRAFMTCIFAAVMTLVHETNVVIFFPVMSFFLLAETDSPTEVRRRRLAICAPILCASATILLVGNTRLGQSSASAMYMALQDKADYPIFQDEFYTTTSTFTENFKNMTAWWHTGDFWHYFASTWVVTLPTTLCILFLTLTALKSSNLRAYVKAWAVAASLAPLSATIIGDDLNRWATLATTTSFLAFVKVAFRASGGKENSPIVPPHCFVLAAAFLCLNLTSSIYLSQGYTVSSFPFEEHISDIMLMIRGEEPFPPHPEKCLEFGCLTVIDGRLRESAVSKEDLRNLRH